MVASQTFWVFALVDVSKNFGGKLPGPRVQIMHGEQSVTPGDLAYDRHADQTDRAARAMLWLSTELCGCICPTGGADRQPHRAEGRGAKGPRPAAAIDPFRGVEHELAVPTR